LALIDLNGGSPYKPPVLKPLGVRPVARHFARALRPAQETRREAHLSAIEARP
jgi:hypothetical protein